MPRRVNKDFSKKTQCPSVAIIPIAELLGKPTLNLSEKVTSTETLGSVWLGQPGALRFEVCELVGTEEPRVQTIRIAWHKRRGRRAVPLIVFWQGPKHFLLTEPIGDPASLSVLQVEPAAALSVIKRAILAPNREAVSVVLALLERTQGSGGVAGFRNRNMLSTHYLIHGFRRDNVVEWIDLDKQSAHRCGERGGNLLRSLGYTATSNPSTFEIRDGDHCRVHAMVLPDGTSFDRSIAGPGDAPATRLLIDARGKGAERAVIVSGSSLRLYFAQSGQGSDDLATAGAYIELDLDILAAEWSALLFLLFSNTSHQADGVFKRVAAESNRYAIGLRERFRERIYENVVTGLVQALYDARGRKRADADTLFNATLRLLYRLLFVLYAEDRNLLPLGNSEYRRVSITEMLFRIQRMRADGKTFDAKQTTLWDDLFRIFEAIRSGNTEWNVPAYNGGLFEPELADHKDAAFLHSVKVPNAILAPLLFALAFDEQDGLVGKIDFGDLGVRHLGTLYEGLLSYSVHIAEQDLVVDRDGMYVPARKQDEPDVLASEPYVTSPKGSRKTSGSYYTPPFVVRRLIDKALRQTLEDHLQRVVTLPVETQWEAMLNFRVVDPAMGSGHFLVDALDAIADRLARFLRDNPRISAEPIQNARAQITAIGKEFGIDNLGKGIGDFELLRRNVMRNCIYGVDLNPMAVELAKLSLWLHAFVPGLPLSYLGHNLRYGNALVGIVGHEIAQQVEGKLFASTVKTSLGQALNQSRTLSSLGDLSIAEVKRSEEAQDKLEGATSGLHGAFDAYSCRVFAVGDDAQEKRIRERGRALLEEADGLDQVLSGAIRGEDKRQIGKAQQIATRLSAFHWQLAFPEVFLRERPGFDVSLGNPPWEEVFTDELDFFVAHIPGIKALSQADREKIVDSFRKRHPAIEEQYMRESESADALRAVLSETYEMTHGGHPDVYRSFAERAYRVTRKSGSIGMVLPRNLFASKGAGPLRKALFSTCECVLDFAENTNGWIFKDVHGQYTLSAASIALNGKRLVHAAGPASNLSEWDTMDENRTTWTFDELSSSSDFFEIPLIPNFRSAKLFHKMAAHGQRFTSPVSGVVFKPYADFNSSTDRVRGILRTDIKGWPAVSGDNFKLWIPEVGEPEFRVDPKVGLDNLLARRKGKKWDFLPPSIRHDKNALPNLTAHIRFHNVANRQNGRSFITALLPSKRFGTHAAPLLIQANGGPRDTALRLGVLSSLPFDWGVRRRVEFNMSFFILEALPVPKCSPNDAVGSRIIQLAASLACIDSRYSEFARACDVGVGTLIGQEREDAIAELDALAAYSYNFTLDDLDIMFSDFTIEAVSEDRRNSVRKHFLTINTPFTILEKASPNEH